MDAELLKLLINAGSFGVVVFTLGWLFVKHIPRLEARQDTKDEAFLAALKDQQAGFDRQSENFQTNAERRHSEIRADVRDLAEKLDYGRPNGRG